MRVPATPSPRDAFVAALPAYAAWIAQSRPLAADMTEAYRPLQTASQMAADGRHSEEVISYLEKQALIAWAQLTVLEELFEGTV